MFSRATLSRPRPRLILAALLIATVAFVLASLMSVGPAVNGAGAATVARDPRTLVIGVSSDPQTLDPEFGQAQRANELLKNIYAQWVHYPAPNAKADISRADVRGSSLTLSGHGR